jgi:hypothetical protein
VFLYAVTLVKLISCWAAADAGISERRFVRALVRFPFFKETEVILDASIDRTDISRLFAQTLKRTHTFRGSLEGSVTDPDGHILLSFLFIENVSNIFTIGKSQIGHRFKL